MAGNKYERTSETIEVVEKREVTSVTVDVESGMTDAIERVQLVKADGSVLSTTTQRTTVPTKDAGEWVNQAVVASSKVGTSTQELSPAE